MAKKRVIKTTRNARPADAAKPTEPLLAAQAGAARDIDMEPHWPDAFIPWRSALFMAGAVVALAALVFGAASLEGFTALKMAWAAWLGAGVPEQVYSSNFDIATVIWGLGTVVFLGIIHPALGIGAIVLARSWLDGYTFPLDNVYFTWSTYALCILWLIRVLRNKEPIRIPASAWIFSALLVYLFLTARYSCQYYNTYQLLWLWLAYGLLFLTCLNILRDARTAGVLLCLFFLAMGAQAVFGILHFDYLLPFMRRAVQNPAVLRSYFGTEVITPEMARRFMMNRAFGTMLFPNALAAYLLLGIPFVLAMVIPYFGDLRRALRRMPPPREDSESALQRFVMMGLAILFGFAVFVFLQFAAYFPKEYQYSDSSIALPLYLQGTPLAALTLAAAVAAGLAALYTLMRLGLWRAWLLFRFAGTALLAPILVYTFWITYSRGAYLALVTALAWAAVLFFGLKPMHVEWAKAKNPLRRAAPVMVAVLLIAVLAAMLVVSGMQPASWAQAPTSRGAEVREEGITLSMGDLADPASFRLRLGYWRVTLRMALNNWRTGVGLGNFAIAYPAYQYIGAGDVREAHNGFLQFFAEAGLLGGLLFGAFWVYFGLWGAIRIIREQDKRRKLHLVAIYAGLVAFCIHAFLDINFSHPSLMMFAMVYCGLFYAAASDSLATCTNEAQTSIAPAVPPRLRACLTTAALLLVIAAAFFGTSRIYFQHLALNRMRFINLSSENELNRRMNAAAFFFHDVANYAILRDRGEKPAELPRTTLASARLIIPDLEVLAAGSSFYRPVPEVFGRFERLEPGEPVPEKALMAVYKPWMLRDAALDASLAWLEELERQDSRFPHSHIFAMHLVKWYEFYVFGARNPKFQAMRPEWIAKYAYWSKTLMRRNPRHADMRLYYANTLVWMAKQEEGRENRDDLLARAEAEYNEMLQLTPISPQHRFAYFEVMEGIAAYFDAEGMQERATDYRAKAKAVRQEGLDLQKRRREAHLYQ